MASRLTLDRQSFEQLLAAASLVQELNQQSPVPFTASPVPTFSAVVEIQQAIETGVLDLQSAAERIVHLAPRLTRAQGCVSWIFTEYGFVYRTADVSGHGDERLARLAKSAALGDQKASLADLSSLWDAAADPLQSKQVKSLLVAPIYQNHEIAGGIAVFSAEPNVFTEPDRTNIRLLAGLLAHALGKSAETRLKQTVNLERATILRAIDQLVPALTKVTELAAAEKLAVANSPGVEADALPRESQPADDLIIPPEICDEILASCEAAQARLDAAQALPLLAASEAPPPEPVPQAPLSTAISSSAEIIPPPLPFDVRPPRGHVAKPPVFRAALAGILDCGASIAEAGLHLAAQLRDKASIYFQTLRSTAKVRWQMARENSIPAWNLLTAAAGSTSHIRVRLLSTPKAYRSLGLAAAVTGLLTLATFLVLTAGITRTGLQTVASAEVEKQTPEIAVTVAKSAKSARSRTKAVLPARQDSPEPPAEPPAQSSHREVTDRSAEAALHALSPFEIPALRRRASFGDDNAAFLLGMAYETGHGVPRNCAKAEEWVARAANQGNPAAQYNLALRYRDGDGVAANPEESQKWLKKAAARNYSEARQPQPAVGHAL